MKLSEAQEKAAQHFEGPCIVLAGPGSGKTYTITARIKYLIEKYKVRPEEILVITFTKAASVEMQKRFVQTMNGTSYPVTFGTFHGVYFGILKWAYGFTAQNILTEEEKYRLIGEIINSDEFREEYETSDEQEQIRNIISEIGNVKNRGIDIMTYDSMNYGISFRNVFREYESMRKKLKKVDFDDMLLLCYQLFQKRPDVLEMWQKRFRYILVDEFQDVNRIQYEVLRMLALPENHIFAVGDDDQSIYQFRGASPDIMLGFEKDYPDVVKYYLDENYRSSRNIVNGALRVISHNKNRFEKKQFATGGKGDSIHIQEVLNMAEESKYILSEIEKATKKGIPMNQIAVLYRTGIDARTMIEKLMEYGIPFYSKEHIQNIYDHFIARHLISYMKLTLGERHRKLFLNVMNVPNRYISRESLESATVTFEDLRKFYIDKEWMQDRIDQFEWDVRMLEGSTPYSAIQYIRKHIDYDDYLKEYAVSRRMNVEDLFAILYEIEEKAKDFKTMEEWIAYTEEYAIQLKNSKEHQDRNGVHLMTMHGAKGLEFHTVFVIQCNEGVAPYKKAKLDHEIEEERRMFYVAMTRAKKRLILTYVKSKHGKDIESSRFIRELLLEK